MLYCCQAIRFVWFGRQQRCTKAFWFMIRTESCSVPAHIDFYSLERSDAFAALKNRTQTNLATYHSSKKSHVTQDADDSRFTMQEHLPRLYNTSIPPRDLLICRE